MASLEVIQSEAWEPPLPPPPPLCPVLGWPSVQFPQRSDELV